MGVLEVLVSYKITRGITLVVGRVTEEIKGGLREFWGGSGRSGGVYLTPIGQVLPSGSLLGPWIWVQTP